MIYAVKKDEKTTKELGDYFSPGELIEVKETENNEILEAIEREWYIHKPLLEYIAETWEEAKEKHPEYFL